VYLTEEIDHAFHCDFVHLNMKVTEMNDFESIECFWQERRHDVIVPQCNLCGIANASPIEARGPEHGAD
jgi:hypothetical protein